MLVIIGCAIEEPQIEEEAVDETIEQLSGCKPTQRDSQGPYIIYDIPVRTVIVPPNATGERLIINGIVYASDCVTPVSNAELNVWQTDEQGKYNDEWYRGRILTDEQGRYEFETIIPGRYSILFTSRPAHIHVRVSSQSYGTFVTQLYFEGDPYLDPDDSDRTLQLSQEDVNGKIIQKSTFDFIFE